MALCPRAVGKRPSVFGDQSETLMFKKRRSDPHPQNTLSCDFPFHCTASSSEDDTSDDEQHGYDIQQARARRRASTRKLFVTSNPSISRTSSLYSDDEGKSPLSSPSLSNAVSTGTGVRRVRSRFSCVDNHSGVRITPPPSSPSSKRLDCVKDNSTLCPRSNGRNVMSFIANPDKQARIRCFDYLVGSIDEAWARYCDATTNLEDQAYGYDIPNTVVTDLGDDDDVYDDVYLSGTSIGTELTDYEFDFAHATKASPMNLTMRASRGSLVSSRCISSSVGDSSSPSGQLQVLKGRLTKAKYFLQDLVDSEHDHDVACFWKRWDMIKYATIELVEDDDDDEVIESTIEDLENGRVQ